MAVQTPDTNSRFDNINGNLRQVLGRFASVTNGDTWTTGLGVIVNCQATSSATAALVATSTSNGIVTFDSTSSNVQVSALGY